MNVTALVCTLQGIAIIRLLKQIEARTQRKIHELFDLVCGTSTGGILAVALALQQMTLEQCEGIYRYCPALHHALMSCMHQAQLAYPCLPHVGQDGTLTQGLRLRSKMSIHGTLI